MRKPRLVSTTMAENNFLCKSASLRFVFPESFPAHPVFPIRIISVASAKPTNLWSVQQQPPDERMCAKIVCMLSIWPMFTLQSFVYFNDANGKNLWYVSEHCGDFSCVTKIWWILSSSGMVDKDCWVFRMDPFWYLPNDVQTFFFCSGKIFKKTRINE